MASINVCTLSADADGALEVAAVAAALALTFVMELEKVEAGRRFELPGLALVISCLMPP